MEARTVIVVAGGDVSARPLPGPLPNGATVIAADGGVDRALALGLHVDLAIGDFDSVSPDGLAAAEAAGARVERAPGGQGRDRPRARARRRDRARPDPDRRRRLGRRAARPPARLGAAARRRRYAGAEIDAYLGTATVHVIRGSRTLTGTPGELVSLLPLHGEAEGVTTEGLEYELRGETLPAGTSRGVSNVFAGTEARVTVERGCLIAVRPAPSERSDCDTLAQGLVDARAPPGGTRRRVRRLRRQLTARRSCSSRTTPSRSRSRSRPRSNRRAG